MKINKGKRSGFLRSSLIIIIPKERLKRYLKYLGRLTPSFPRHIGKYLKYNAEHVERLYYCEKREGI